MPSCFLRWLPKPTVRTIPFLHCFDLTHRSLPAEIFPDPPEFSRATTGRWDTLAISSLSERPSRYSSGYASVTLLPASSSPSVVVRCLQARLQRRIAGGSMRPSTCPVFIHHGEAGMPGLRCGQERGGAMPASSSPYALDLCSHHLSHPQRERIDTIFTNQMMPSPLQPFRSGSIVSSTAVTACAVAQAAIKGTSDVSVAGQFDCEEGRCQRRAHGATALSPPSPPPDNPDPLREEATKTAHRAAHDQERRQHASRRSRAQRHHDGLHHQQDKRGRSNHAAVDVFAMLS